MARVDSAGTAASPSAGGFGHWPQAPGIGRRSRMSTITLLYPAIRCVTPWLVTSKVMTSSHEAPQEDAQIQVSIGPVDMSRLALLLFDTAWVKDLAEDPAVRLSIETDTGTISVDALCEPPKKERRASRCSKCNRPNHNRRTCTYKRRLA